MFAILHKNNVSKGLEMGLEANALLLFDSVPTHPAATNLVSKGGNIRAMYLLPPNTTALFHPMDQGVLEAFKRR